MLINGIKKNSLFQWEYERKSYYATRSLSNINKNTAKNFGGVRFIILCFLSVEMIFNSTKTKFLPTGKAG